MKLIVGLGNPGDRYKNTRHNAGFIFLDSFAEKNGLAWSDEGKFKSETTKIGDFILAKPQTYMNLSGEAVSALVNFYNIKLADVLIIHDDVDLPFAETKVQLGRGAAGHHGVQNIIELLGTQEFLRLRLGIGRPPKESHIEVEDYVLMPFGQKEIEDIQDMGGNILLEKIFQKV